MTEPDVAIVGSGIVAATIAHLLTERGHRVVVLEKGPEFPYPHEPQFREQILYLRTDNPAWLLPPDLKRVTLSGDYAKLHLDIGGELGMVVGGSATHWGGVALRMRPTDFATRTKYGFGDDWPINYADLEPYYCRAEALIGVAGTDDDNPFAPPRSAPFPLPPFELSWDDQVLAERLRSHGIVLHTTPQARTRLAYDGRPGCMNFGVCPTCPVGVRYSPNHHLAKAVATGRCEVRASTSVRRVVLDGAGRARALVLRRNDAARDEELAARFIVVAGGALESARLLLLSGVGNTSGQVGRNLVFHHYHSGVLHYADALFPGRLGPQTAQSQQFVEPETRGRHGGIKIDFHSWPVGPNPWERTSGAEVLADLEVMKRSHPFGLHSESVTSPAKWVGLSSERDRFGDPFVHLHYDSAELDYATYEYGRTLFDRFAKASGAIGGELTPDPNEFSSGAHHMGTCRMGTSPADSVVDPHCRVHGSPNLYVVGAAAFRGGSGAVHPTLTIAALAIRAADRLLEALA